MKSCWNCAVALFLPRNLPLATLCRIRSPSWLLAPLISVALLALNYISADAKQSKDAGSVSDSFVPFHWLDDATYDPSLHQLPGVSLVIFLDEQSVAELVTLKQVGPGTNRLQTFVVNITTNRMLAAKLGSGQLGNVSAAFTVNGKPVIQQRTPCWLLLFRGVGVDSGEIWDKPAFWPGLDRRLAEWLYKAVDLADHAYRQKMESEEFRDDVTINFGTKTDETVALMGEALAHENLFERAGWSSPCLKALDVLGRIDPPEAAKPAIPVLLQLLEISGKVGDWKRREMTVAACHALARIGWRLPKDQREPLVAPLTKLAEQFVTQAQLTGEGFNIQPGVAAIQALGALGPVARLAAPVLARFAEKVYPHASQAQGAGDHEIGHSIALLASYCLARIELSAPPRDASARIRGKGLHVITGKIQKSTVARSALIFFWNGRNCYTAICDNQGRYDIQLPPGTYVCGWALDHDHLLFAADANRLFFGLPVVKARAGATEKFDVAVSTIFVD